LKLPGFSNFALVRAHTVRFRKKTGLKIVVAPFFLTLKKLREPHGRVRLFAGTHHCRAHYI
jgi:hypothetical protein